MEGNKMAVNFSVDNKRGSVYDIAPRDLRVRPELNGRIDAPDIDAKLASLVREGQLTPLLIGSDGGVPYIIDGHTRWRAAIKGIKDGLLPAEFRLRCVYFKGTPVDEFRACVAANHERDNATPDDDAANIARFQRYGMTNEEIAEFYHEEVPWVMGRLSRLSLTPESRDAVKQGRVKQSAIKVLAKLSREQQAEAIKAEKVTPASVKAVVSGSSNGHRKPSKSEVMKATIRAAAGGDIPVDIGGMTASEAVVTFAKYLLGEK